MKCYLLLFFYYYLWLRMKLPHFNTFQKNKHTTTTFFGSPIISVSLIY